MIRPVAIYLPQFHPTSENDSWWGKGFTEWTNVTKAKPLFSGHYQPRLPADLGFYDLRAIETIIDQAELARANGIHGFSFYHYWFHGKRLLHEPIDLILHTHQPDFPFLLFWANESWSRRWLGEERDILIQQQYSDADDEAHAAWLCEKVFCDPRYIRVNDKPVFAIYRPGDFPDIRKTLATFRRVAAEKGYKGLYMIGNNAHGSKGLETFDIILNFEPQLGMLEDAFDDSWKWKRWRKNLSRFGVNNGRLKIYDYREVKERMKGRRITSRYIPCPFVGWDNTARRGDKGIIIHNSDADVFEESLRNAKQVAMKNEGDEQLIFINAWNEWAEGNHLEPCIQYGSEFLSRVKKVFAS